MSYLCNRLLTILCPCWFKQATTNFSHFEEHQNLQNQQFIKQQFDHSDYTIQHHQNNFEQQNNHSIITISKQQSHKFSPSIIQYQKHELPTHKHLQKFDEQINQQIVTKEYQENIGFEDYTSVISDEHPYYSILYEKIQKLPTLFQIDEKYRLNCPQTSYPLKMYCKQSEDNKTNIFIYFFQFPGNYESYETLLNDFELQKSFDNNIDEYYKKIQSPNHQTKVIYLSYKKVLIVSPRDFIYARYTFKKEKQFWSISTSIPDQEQIQGKIRGQIHLTATKVVEKNNKIQVSVYSQVDMKMAIKPEMAKNRGMGQIRKYLDKCYKSLNESKNVNII